MGGGLVLPHLIEVPFDHSKGAWRVFAEKGGGEAWEVSDVALGQSKLESRKGWGEEGSMGKRNKFGRCGGADGGMGGVRGRHGKSKRW